MSKMRIDMYQEGDIMDDENLAENIKKEKVNEYKRNYYHKNKDSEAKRKQKWYIKNKEEIAKRQKAYKEKNKDKLREYYRRYREANKEKINKRKREKREQDRKKVDAKLILKLLQDYSLRNNHIKITTEIQELTKLVNDYLEWADLIISSDK